MNGHPTAYRPFPAALWQTVVIVLLGAALGLAFNSLRDGGIPLVGSVRVVKFDKPAVPASAEEGVGALPAEIADAVESETEEPSVATELETVEPEPAVVEPPAALPPPAEEPAVESGVEVFSPVPLEQAEEQESGPKALDLTQALELFDSGMAVFVDARMPDEFVTGHIPGAFNLPYDELEAHLEVLTFLPEDGMVVTYCDGSECEASLELADELTAMGFGQVRVFFGGWEQWLEAGHPVEEGEALLPY